MRGILSAIICLWLVYGFMHIDFNERHETQARRSVSCTLTVQPVNFPTNPSWQPYKVIILSVSGLAASQNVYMAQKLSTGMTVPVAYLGNPSFQDFSRLPETTTNLHPFSETVSLYSGQATRKSQLLSRCSVSIP